MTLLGTGATFSVGSSGVGSSDPTMGKSLDEIIQSRRKDQKKDLKRGPKKPTNVEKSVASARAKRDAANRARRGMSDTNKPSKMDVEKEVKREVNKNAVQKKKQEQKQFKGRLAPDSSGRSRAKKDKQKADPPAAILGGRAPPKKAIEAAIKGMESAGYKVPDGHQMVMTFVPAVVASPPAPAKKQENQRSEGKGNKKGGNTNQKGNKNNNGGGGAGGGRNKK